MHTRSRTGVWTALAASTATASWFWRRDRERRLSAERLAAATLETLLFAIDANDRDTGLHVRRTAAYAHCLTLAMGLDESAVRKVERVALFHDIGKVHAALFDIVHDDSELSEEERRLIATHPERGAEVLAPLAAFYPELPAGVLAHHERWDGTGYPRRLSGAAIPFEARVVAIADSFDAITHSRRYHAGESTARGRAVIADGRGEQFDPDLADLFLSERVFADIESTVATSAARERNELRPRTRSAERRDRRPESVVPEVRFRWRAPSAVTSAAPPP